MSYTTDSIVPVFRVRCPHTGKIIEARRDPRFAPPPKYVEHRFEYETRDHPRPARTVRSRVTLSPSIERILIAVGELYGCTPEALVGQSRARSISWPRQMAYLIAYDHFGFSMPQVGKMMGGRDHTTIDYGRSTCWDRIRTIRKWREDYHALAEALQFKPLVGVPE